MLLQELSGCDGDGDDGGGDGGDDDWPSLD